MSTVVPQSDLKPMTIKSSEASKEDAKFTAAKSRAEDALATWKWKFRMFGILSFVVLLALDSYMYATSRIITTVKNTEECCSKVCCCEKVQNRVWIVFAAVSVWTSRLFWEETVERTLQISGQITSHAEQVASALRLCFIQRTDIIRWSSLWYKICKIVGCTICPCVSWHGGMNFSFYLLITSSRRDNYNNKK